MEDLETIIQGLSVAGIPEMTKARAELQERTSEMFELTARQFARSYPQMEAAADRLADLGWTMPMLVTPRRFVELADPLYSDSDIETMLSDFYTAVDCEQLRVVQKHMLNATPLERWRGLLGEAFEAFYLN